MDIMHHHHHHHPSRRSRQVAPCPDPAHLESTQEVIAEKSSYNNNINNINNNGSPHQRRPRKEHSPRSSSPSSCDCTEKTSCRGKNFRRNNSRRHQQGGGAKRQPKRKNADIDLPDPSLFAALDCEMVGIGPNGHASSVARVTLIDWDGKTILDEYIQQTQPVTDYRTFVSGITEQHLDNAVMTLDECREQVQELLQGRILVGHALKNDLRALKICHPWWLIRDTAKYEPFMQVRFDDGILWPRKLKDLAHEKLHQDIQVQGRPHCPIEDALAALDLYRSVQKKWEKVILYKVEKTNQIRQQQQEEEEHQEIPVPASQ